MIITVSIVPTRARSDGASVPGHTEQADEATTKGTRVVEDKASGGTA